LPAMTHSAPVAGETSLAIAAQVATASGRPDFVEVATIWAFRVCDRVVEVAAAKRHRLHADLGFQQFVDPVSVRRTFVDRSVLDKRECVPHAREAGITGLAVTAFQSSPMGKWWVVNLRHWPRSITRSAACSSETDSIQEPSGPPKEQVRPAPMAYSFAQGAAPNRSLSIEQAVADSDPIWELASASPLQLPSTNVARCCDFFPIAAERSAQTTPASPKRSRPCAPAYISAGQVFPQP